MMNATGDVADVGGSLALRELILETTRDVAYALRMLKRTRGFAAVAITTLALGIGASTALFTVVDSVLLRPLRFTEPDRLAVIRPTSGSRVSAGYLYDWRLQNRSMVDIAGWRDQRANLAGREGPIEVLVDQTTANYFSVLGTDDRVRAFGSALLERVEHLPGVLAAGSVNYLPMSRFGVADRFEIEGRPETRLEDQKFSWVSVAGGRYFEAMGIPLLRGRLPDESDATRARPVFLIDEELARRYWPDEDAVGAHIVWRRGQRAMLSGEIIGIVGSVRWQTMAAEPDATAYWWFSNAPSRELTIVARTAGRPSALARLIAAQVGEIDPDQPVADIRPMQDLVSADLARPRFTMLLLGGFAAVALLMAGIGLHGVVALSVAQRTREIGVRIALGATPLEVFRLVMRRGISVVGTGLAIGVVPALAFGRFVTVLLYGISPTDPTTLVAVSLFLSAVVLLASFVPARRATRIDPVAAMRGE